MTLNKLFPIGTLVILFLGWVVISSSTEKSNELAAPMDDFANRPKLLTYGLFVTPDPANNPIDPPERFSGYHTALDVEIFESELNEEVEVFAICTGKLIFADTANGYGGVMVQVCNINQQDVTVLYGHLDPKSFAYKASDQISKGQKIAVLGDHKSEETSDTRKHLHLAIHKGSELVFAGYVQSEQELQNYIDPLPLLSH